MVRDLVVGASIAIFLGILNIAAVETAPPEKRFGWVLLPALNYDSDFGFGYGVRGALYHFAHRRKPYEVAVEAQAFASTGGQQVHFLSIDLPSLGGSRFRFKLEGGYASNVGESYYGIGNVVSLAPNPNRYYYYYRHTVPNGVLSLRYAIRPELYLFTVYRLSFTSVGAYAGSLLDETRPFGFAGGRYGELAAGLLYDSRDEENDPTRGLLIEIAGRTAQSFLGSQYSTYAVFASAAGFRPLTKWLVVAGRLGVDWELGDVPFDQLSEFGALFQTYGLGGGSTIRGLLQNQYIGNGKLLGNLEARFRIYRFSIRRRPIGLGAVAFVDGGRVWSQTRNDGDGINVHIGVGGGLRVIWEDVFVVRADCGYGEGNVRFYVDIGHFF